MSSNADVAFGGSSDSALRTPQRGAKEAREET